MTVRRVLFSLILAIIAVPLIASGIQVMGQPADQAAVTPLPAPPTTLQATAVPQAATTAISALGSVEAKSVVELYFQTSGTVQGIYVQVGDSVQAGDVLADLDASDGWNSYNQARLSLESAQLSMQTLLEPATDSEIAVAKANVASAQAAYSSTANGSSDQIAQLQLKYQQAQDQLTALQTARQNMNGSADEIALQDAKIGAQSFSVETARLQLEAAQTPDSSALWSASVRIQQAQVTLDKLQAAPAQSDIDSAQLAIDRAQAKVEDAQTALTKTQLIAPISGTVTAINVAAGNSAGTGTAVLKISDTSSLQMTVPVNELDVKGVAVGQSAAIQLDALSGVELPGTVENVGWISSTSSDGIVTYDVRVVLNNADPRVRIGMTGEVAITTGSAS